MRFTFTEQQQLIQDSALDWLRDNYDFHQRAASVHCEGGNLQVWQALADLGWLGLPLAEDIGGLAGDAISVGLVAQALGRHLVVEPYVAHVVLAMQAMDRCATSAQRLSWLPPLVAGQQRLAWAHAEPGEVSPFDARACTAEHTGGGLLIRGAKQGVRGAAGATHWLVSATLKHNGQQLLLRVPREQEGVRIDGYRTSDGACAADLYFDGALVPMASVLGDGNTSTNALESVVCWGIVTACWQATGAMQAALEQTRRYTAERHQFGQALAQFQVVQHRLAEMGVLCLEAQAACELASMRMTRIQGEGLRAVAAGARSKVARAGTIVSQDCVQLHGAMGVCEELPIAATFRYLLAFEVEDGSADAHAQWLGEHAHTSQRYAISQTLGDL